MKKNIHALIILPENYTKTSNDNACLILLHGWGGNYLSWDWAYSGLKQKADQYKMIIVCPDGGFDSWYINSPLKKHIRYETFVADELISFLRNQYHISQHRNKCTIAGISMGGHGAAYLALKYKHIFGGFASTSGGLDLSGFPNGWNLKRLLGKQSRFPENWKNHSAISHLASLENNELKIWIDCGLSDFFLSANQKFHEAMILMGIKHQYHEWEGGHDQAYWSLTLPKMLNFIGEFMDNKK